MASQSPARGDAEAPPRRWSTRGNSGEIPTWRYAVNLTPIRERVRPAGGLEGTRDFRMIGDAPRSHAPNGISRPKATRPRVNRDSNIPSSPRRIETRRGPIGSRSWLPTTGSTRPRDASVFRDQLARTSGRHVKLGLGRVSEPGSSSPSLRVGGDGSQRPFISRGADGQPPNKQEEPPCIRRAATRAQV